VFDKILIANRGEIAVRVARTCHELGVTAVAVHSDADSRARHVRAADEAIALQGTAPADTYLNIDALLEAARRAGARAIHPGYGFLAEDPAFAQAVGDAGLAWIGPPPEAMRLVADKVSARTVARTAGLPLVEGTPEPLRGPDDVRDFARAHGYPVAVKAAAGGGGRGFRVVRSPAEADVGFDSARRESLAYFGAGAVYAERYLEAPKHMEVQILAPNEGEALWLGVRDCSLQRRRQKLIEETPPPRFSAAAGAMGSAALRMAAACGYRNAGTVEFLVDADGRFYFLEVNARLQVEHTVTEEVTGLDLVACQLRIASGDPLELAQADVEERGHCIECRINAEDPTRSFAPAPGVIVRWEEPGGPGVRVDSGYGAGDEVSEAYDSLLAKVCAWGRDREQARMRMLRALDEFVIEGVPTTIPAHRALVTGESFVTGRHTSTTVETSGLLESPASEPSPSRGRSGGLLAANGRRVSLWNPAMSASAVAAVEGTGGDGLVAPMQGSVLKVPVVEGDHVEAGDVVVVLEAMKMETAVAAPRAGTVTGLRVAAGDTVAGGDTLAVIE
jgi:acetyl-CoA/propionyl-CoA carboxylase, biotin carboxylase, biotin carboxyl carrier protein